MPKRSKSIVQMGDPRCFVCGRRRDLERHHILGGVANRPLSEKFGLWVWLCQEHHTGPKGAQYDPELNQVLKRLAQIAFEARHSHGEWMEIFKKNYI